MGLSVGLVAARSRRGLAVAAEHNPSATGYQQPAVKASQIVSMLRHKAALPYWDDLVLAGPACDSVSLPCTVLWYMLPTWVFSLSQCHAQPGSC